MEEEEKRRRLGGRGRSRLGVADGEVIVEGAAGWRRASGGAGVEAGDVGGGAALVGDAGGIIAEAEVSGRYRR